MLDAISLGWQGWALTSQRACLLIDPVLVDGVGRGPAPARLTFPFGAGRSFDWQRFPPVDAVVLTHEHEDHFNIPTLARLDRNVPVYLSARASTSAFTVLRELGFDARPLEAGSSLSFGDLRLRLFGPDLVAAPLADEWDTLAFLATSGDGCAFFSNVDVRVTPEMLDAVAEAGRGGEVLAFEGMCFVLWDGSSTPAGSDQMHRPREDAVRALHGGLAVLREGRPLRPFPGQTGRLAEGRLVEVTSDAPFLRAKAVDGSAPGRATGGCPALGAASVDDVGLEELEDFFREFAAFLYGRPVFTRLHSLTPGERGARKPSFLWVVLLGDGDAVAYEYEPRACAFLPVEEKDVVASAADRYMGVVTCWGTDLLGLWRGTAEPRLVQGHFHQRWAPGWRYVELFGSEVCPFFHPLRWPHKVLRRYREVMEEERQAPIAVRHASGR